MSNSPATLRVLVVDDERCLADTFVMILKGCGYNALPVYDGAVAAELAAIFKPHAVLSDVMMPGLNGFELAKRIQEQLPDCHVLLMTGHPDAAKELRATLPKVSATLRTKPVLPQAVLAFLTHCAESLDRS